MAAGRGGAGNFPPRLLYRVLLDLRITPRRVVSGRPQPGCFSSLVILNMSIIHWEVAMPTLQAFGPSAGRAPVPPPIAGASAAARRYGVLPVPSLEWNAQVEGETAHLYDRVRTVIPPVEWPFFAPY